MSADELNYLYLVVGAITLFGAVLAWTERYSNRAKP